jgi:hypothetical protein
MGSNSNDLVKFALLLKGWDYESGDRSVLMQSGTKITSLEYEQDMDGSLFCPICTTNLIRRPKDKPLFSNNRRASFAHLPKYKHVVCSWRTKIAEGKQYLTEEEAKQAISSKRPTIPSVLTA